MNCPNCGKRTRLHSIHTCSPREHEATRQLSAASCGCKIVTVDGSFKQAIQYCPLHQSATELLRQLKALADQVEAADMYVPPNVTAIITQAESK